MEENQGNVQEREEWRKDENTEGAAVKYLEGQTKAAAIIQVMEQMVERRSWKRTRNIPVESIMCMICKSYKEAVYRLNFKLNC